MKKHLIINSMIIYVVIFLLCAITAIADETVCGKSGDIIYGNSFVPYTYYVSQTGSLNAGASAAEIKKIEQEEMEAYFKKLKVSITPYMFFFAMDAGIAVGDRVSNSVISPDQVRSMLSSQFNVRLDVNKAHWGGFIDTSNMAFNKHESVSKLQADVTMNVAINHYCAYYRCTGLPVLDIYGGARTYSFSNDLTLKLGGLPSRSIQSVNAWTDPIIGARLTQPLSKNFALMVGGDGGGFMATQKSMSLYGLLAWEITPVISLNGGYEYMKFKKDKSEAIVDTFNMSMTMYGPVASIAINF